MEKILFCFSIVLFSCQETSSHTPPTRKKIIVQEVKKDEAQLKIDDFSLFWTEFKRAIKETDSSRIIQLTETTLQLMGREDSDPRIKLSGQEIAKAILYVANNGGYFDEKLNKSVSYREFLQRNTSDIEEFNQASKQQWIKDFLFKHTEYGWRLSVLYTNTVNYK